MSAAVLAKLRELVADGLSVPLCVEQLNALGYRCSRKQVKKWKAQHGIRRFAKVSDAAIDVVVQRLKAAGKLGAREGYRWVHSAVNAEFKPQRIGLHRVRKALLRLAPAEVAGRRKAVEKRLIRRVYHMDYYGQARRRARALHSPRTRRALAVHAIARRAERGCHGA